MNEACKLRVKQNQGEFSVSCTGCILAQARRVQEVVDFKTAHIQPVFYRFFSLVGLVRASKIVLLILTSLLV